MPKEFATLSTYPSTGLHYNHLEKTRFRDPQDPAFRAILAELLRWSKPINQVVKPHAANGPGPKAKLPSRIGKSRLRQLNLVASKKCIYDMLTTPEFC